MGRQQEPSSDILRYISVGCLGLGLILFLISFGTPFWARTNLHLAQRDEHIGLWKYCVTTDGASIQKCDDFVDRGNYGGEKQMNYFPIRVDLSKACLPSFLEYVYIYETKLYLRRPQNDRPFRVNLY